MLPPLRTALCLCPAPKGCALGGRAQGACPRGKVWSAEYDAGEFPHL